MVTAIIVASGWGKRLGYPEGKQFLDLLGRPVVSYSISAFISHPYVDIVLVVINPEDKNKFIKMKKELYFQERKLRHCFGGKERLESVKKGLEKARSIMAESFDDSVILIHDGARPLITEEVITRVIKGVEKFGSAVCGILTTDTVKVVKNGRVLDTPDRRNLYLAQTPQGFRGSILWASYQGISLKRDYLPTDDSSVVESKGFPVYMVEGSRENIKLTTESDLAIIREIMKRRK